METLEQRSQIRKGIYIPLAGAFIADIEEAKNPDYFKGHEKEENLCLGIAVISTLLAGSGLGYLIRNYEPQITDALKSLGSLVL